MFQPDDLVRVPYPLPGQERDPRESWPWLRAVVCSVFRPDANHSDTEYVVAIQDEQVAEYDPTGDDPDQPFEPIAFRDPSEVRAEWTVTV